MHGLIDDKSKTEDFDSQRLQYLKYAQAMLDL